MRVAGLMEYPLAQGAGAGSKPGLFARRCLFREMAFLPMMRVSQRQADVTAGAMTTSRVASFSRSV
jgi:hypothetical protein